MKAAGVGAGFMIASGYSPFSYAQNEKIHVGCIGTGGQGTFHLRDGIAGAESIEVVAIADVFLPHQKGGVMYGQCSNGGVKIPAGVHPNDLPVEDKIKIRDARRPNGYYNYKEMLEKETLDAVVIATPLTAHYQPTMDCLDLGKYVFCEKTLVKTIEDGRNIITKCHETGKFVQVGHQRRYNPKYLLAMDMAREKGLLGRITHLTAQWHRNTYWRRAWQQEYPNYALNEEEMKYIPDLEKHLNWRMYQELSGGLYTELATHQTDIANWFMHAVPKRVNAFGGIDYWRDGRDVDDNIMLSFEYEFKPGDPGFMTVDRRSELQKMAMLNRPYTVRFAYSSILMNMKRGSSELIQGDWGSVELTEQDCFFFPEPNPRAEAAARLAAAQAAQEGGDAAADENKPNTIQSGGSLQVDTKALKEGVGLLVDRELKTPDVYQFEAFAHHIKNGGVPRSNQMVGFTTAITALAAIQSRTEGRIVEIDPEWYAFNFETPSFYDWAWEDEKYPKLPGAETPPQGELPAEVGAQPDGAAPVDPAAPAAPAAPAEPVAPAAPAAPAEPAPAAPVAPEQV
jgi:predicted dehydrogenase